MPMTEPDKAVERMTNQEAAELYRHMKLVAEANGFESLTDAIVWGCKGKAAEAQLAAQSRALEEGWLNVLCPTDGVWRCHRLPDGREVVAAFEGRDLGPQVRKWRVKEFAYHNPQRPTGEVFGGIECMTASYDTYARRTSGPTTPYMASHRSSAHSSQWGGTGNDRINSHCFGHIDAAEIELESNNYSQGAHA